MHKMFVVLPGIVLWAARMYENVLTYSRCRCSRSSMCNGSFGAVSIVTWLFRGPILYCSLLLQLMHALEKSQQLYICTKHTYCLHSCSQNPHHHILCMCTHIKALPEIWKNSDCNLTFIVVEVEYKLKEASLLRRSTREGGGYLQCYKAHMCPTESCMWTTPALRTFSS